MKVREVENPGAGLFGFTYFLTVIGAMVYFIGHAATFWLGVLGFFKAFVWPVFVVYQVLGLLGL